ncbi:MAG: hypothetical protein KBA60_11885 [Flavobacteriales bacterium]|nr:hypothetical protein [Flavobacteriales bacterium]MBP6643529.1 hypothetical protein [Flavobacteriales bacterium]MBP7156704.1 hypothetical protein [Flavobacteriales bacterium]HQW39873.1 hypothetical protein [Flavobacteriales bacterium]
MLRSRALIIAAICTLVACVVHLAYGPTRADFRELIIAFTVAFVAYLFIVRNGSISWSHLLTLAIGLRIALLFAQVTWTDDHYRYIWDGLCSVQGASPFAHIPEELVVSDPQIFTPAHFSKLNSPRFYSVYPPVAQAVFAISAWVGGGDLWRSTLALRVIMVAFDLVAILLLGMLLAANTRRTQLVALYALNPLVLMEFTVNIHTEALMIAPTLAAILYFRRQLLNASAVFLAIGAAAKLWPLFFLAWIPSQLGIKQSVRFIGLVLGLFIVSWIPLYTTEMLPHFSSSLALYVRYLEFNGPLFEGLRWLFGDDVVKGTGLLSALTLIGLGAYSLFLLKTEHTNWPEAMLWLLAIYLIGAQAVHPWYMLPLVAFAPLTGWRWPVLWSLLIVPTYLTYASEPFTQPYWWLVIEYCVLAIFMGWEFWSKRARSQPAVC